MSHEFPSFATVLAERDHSGADLSGMSLGSTNLSGKCFKDADLSNVQLGRANLAGADLRNANLYQANLGAADLTGADLRYADLREANLTGANMMGADVRHALGLDQPFVIPVDNSISPHRTPDSDDFKKARREGYDMVGHWAKSYTLLGKRMPIFEDIDIWRELRNRFGELIFRNQEIFGHTRLVQQFNNFPRWVYLITAEGFEVIMRTLGHQVASLSDAD